MATKDSITTNGLVADVLPGTMFRVKRSNRHLVLAHISGKMRKHFIRIATGGQIKAEMSPYDLTKARITFRNSTPPSQNRR